MGEEILTPKHQYWRAFTYRLNDMLHLKGCNELTHTRKILTSLFNIDVEGTVNFYKDLGGYDDREVLINVESIWKGKPLKERRKYDCKSTI